MKFTFLNSKIKHKRFDFQPFYYDERKERLQQKVKSYQKAQDPNISPEERAEILRNNMKETWSRSATTQKSISTSNFRIIFLIALILILGYFVFNGVNEVDTVVKKLW